MIKVVIDTNVVVSANLVGQGPSAAIFQLAVEPKNPDSHLSGGASGI